MSPIADYLDELSGLLRLTRRRRILGEVRAHLIDASSAALARGADPLDAEHDAVRRFGSPLRVAHQFNAVRARPRALIARATAVAAAAAASATIGTATVWAVPGGASPRVHPHAQAHRPHHGARR
jgi:hypothetical protein